MSESKAGARRTLEFKLEAVRLVIQKQRLKSWVRLANKGQLKAVGFKPLSPE